MDTTLRTLDRAAASGDPDAARRALASRVRLGELPHGCLVVLDAARSSDDWPIPGPNPWRRTGQAPKKLTGRWEITGSYERAPFGGAPRERSYFLAKVGQNGRRLKAACSSTHSLRESRLRELLVRVEVPGESTKRVVSVERAPANAQIVRQFSPCGPCLTQGRLVRETAKFYVVEVDGADANVRMAKSGGGYHAEPCRSCLDHAQTSYPYGYMD